MVRESGFMSRAGGLRAASLVCACLFWGPLAPGDLFAQTGPSASPVSGRFELGGAIGWAGSSDLGSEKATLTGNGVPSGAPVTLFDAASTLSSGATYEGRLAWRLDPTFAIEGVASVTPSDLQTRITGDFEGADPVTVTERVRQFTVEGGLVVHLNALRFGWRGRIVPFVTGGGGYLRQLHDGETLATDGGAGYAGGGVKVDLRRRDRGWAKGFGLRADVKMRIHSGGFDLGERKVRVHPAATGGLYLRF